jgi:hypothetical protein
MADLTQQMWRDVAAALSAELGVKIHWCPLGFEVPCPDGSLTHVSSMCAVRALLGQRHG